jgi:Flp pilus assembly protein CpaB
VATEFIPRGTAGDDVINLFRATTIVEEDLPANAITTADQLTATLSGSVALGPISANQVVTTDVWGAAAEEVAGLSELIAPGFQALSIRPDEVRAVGGFLRPGDRINVIASTEVDMTAVIDALLSPAARAVFFPDLQANLGFTDEEMVGFAESLPDQIRFTQFVLQDIRVLAVGPEAQGGPVVEPDPETDEEGLPRQQGETVTVEVDAEQAESLVFVQEYLNTWLTLVPDDYEPVETEGVVLDDLIDLPQDFVEELERLSLLLSGGGTGTTTTTTTTVPVEGGEEGTGG